MKKIQNANMLYRLLPIKSVRKKFVWNLEHEEESKKKQAGRYFFSFLGYLTRMWWVSIKVFTRVFFTRPSSSNVN